MTDIKPVQLPSAEQCTVLTLSGVQLLTWIGPASVHDAFIYSSTIVQTQEHATPWKVLNHGLIDTADGERKYILARRSLSL